MVAVGAVHTFLTPPRAGLHQWVPWLGVYCLSASRTVFRALGLSFSGVKGAVGGVWVGGQVGEEARRGA